MNVLITILSCIVFAWFGVNYAAASPVEPAAEPAERELFPVPEPLEGALKDLCKERFGRVVSQLEEIPPKQRDKISAWYYFLKGAAKFRQGDFAAATRELTLARDARRSNSDTLYLLGVSAFQQGFIEEAKAILQEAVWFGRHTLVPKEIVHERLAIVLERLDEPEKAVAQYNQALKANPEFQSARAAIARIAFAEGNLQQARLLTQHVMKEWSVPADEPEPDAADEAAVPNEPTKERAKAKPGTEQGCRRQRLQEVLIGGARPHVEVELLFVRSLLGGADRVRGKETIERAIESAREIAARPDLEPDYAVEAKELLVRALMEGERFEEADLTLQQALQKYPNHRLLNPLPRQLEIERRALRDTDDPAQSESNT